MTKKFIFSLISVASFGAFAQEAAPVEEAPAMEQEKDYALSFSVDQTIATKYVWRGIVYNKNQVNQGAVTAGLDTDLGTFSANVWYNLDLHDENDEELEFTEVDYTIAWEKEFDIMTLGAGVIHYDYPSETFGSATTDVYASVGLNIILNPSVTAYYDFDNVNGAYISFGAGHDFEIEALNTTLSLGGALGYANSGQSGNFGDDFDGGFTDAALTASLLFDITESLSISPFVTATTLLDDARNDVNNNGNDSIYAGVSLSYTF